MGMLTAFGVITAPTSSMYIELELLEKQILEKFLAFVPHKAFIGI